MKKNSKLIYLALFINENGRSIVSYLNIIDIGVYPWTNVLKIVQCGSVRFLLKFCPRLECVAAVDSLDLHNLNNQPHVKTMQIK